MLVGVQEGTDLPLGLRPLLSPFWIFWETERVLEYHSAKRDRPDKQQRWAHLYIIHINIFSLFSLLHFFLLFVLLLGFVFRHRV